MSKLRLMRSAVSRRPDPNNPSVKNQLARQRIGQRADEILLDIDDW
jgi:hypothetical protein